MADISKRELNLYRSYQNKIKIKKKPVKKSSNTSIMVIVSILMTLILGVSYAVLYLDLQNVNSDSEELSALLLDVNLQNQKTEANSISISNNMMQSLITGIKSFEAAGINNDYSYLTKDMLTRIVDCCDKNITLISYSVENKNMSLELVSPTALGVSAFVQKFETLGCFYNVNYSGFSYGEQDGYAFELTCTLTAQNTAEVD